MSSRPFGERGASSAGRVLLVDSYDDTRELYAESLKFFGFDVVTDIATDDALRHAGNVDAVVTGIAVKGSMDGIELVRRLRRAEATARKAIIVLTAHTLDSHRRQAITAGADAFLPKPCLPGVLAEELRRVLTTSRTRVVRALARRLHARRTRNPS